MKSAEELAPVVRDFAESIGLFDPAREIVGGWTDRLMIRRRLIGVIEAFGGGLIAGRKRRDRSRVDSSNR